MFSWLQTNLEKHFRLLFIVLLVVLIVSFVFTIGNQGPLGGDNERLANLHFFEQDLSSTAKLQKFQQTDPRLSAILSGNFRTSETYAFERATALHIANQHKVPDPTSEELQAFIKTRPIFQDANGDFDTRSYNMMIDNLKLSAQATEADLARVLKEDYRIEKVFNALRGNNSVSEAEVLEQVQKSATQWTTLVATYPLNDYKPEFEVSQEALQTYYDNHKINYRTPERRSVDYVEFTPATFASEIEPTDLQLTNYFEENYDRYQPKANEPEEGEEAEPVQPVTFEDVKNQVRQDYVQARSVEIAHERANDLVIELIDRNIPLGSTVIDQKIADFGLQKKTTPFFAANETPIGTTWNADILKQAFALSKERYYSEPVQIGRNTLIIFYKNQTDSVIPEFSTVASAVERDYRAQELAIKRAERAKELQQELAAASESEESFGIAAETAGLSTQRFEGFSADEPAENLSRNVLASLMDLDVGEVSEPVIDQQKNTASYAYVVKKEIPEVDASAPQYAQIENALQRFYGQAVIQQYIAPLMETEMVRSGFVRPN